MSPGDAGLRQRVIERQYWLTAPEMAVLLGLPGPPAGPGFAWRGHEVLPVPQTGMGPPLWRLGPGHPPTTGRLQRIAGAAAEACPSWLPLVPAGSQLAELPPLLMRAVVGWVAQPLPAWLERFGWPVNGRAHLQLWVGPTTALPPGFWPPRPVVEADSLAMAIALGDGAEWRSADGATVLHAGDVVLACEPPVQVLAGDPPPLWLVGWVIRRS